MSVLPQDQTSALLYGHLYAHNGEKSILDKVGPSLESWLHRLLMSGENIFGNPWKTHMLKVTFYIRKILDLVIFASLLIQCGSAAHSKVTEVFRQFRV